MAEYAQIADFLLSSLVCLGVRNTVEAGEKPLHNRDGRVASYLRYDLAFTRGCTEAEEVFHRSKVGCLDVFRSRTAAWSGTGSPFWRASFIAR